MQIRVNHVLRSQRRLSTMLEARVKDEVRVPNRVIQTPVAPGLWRLPTSVLLRSMALGSFFKSPRLYRYGFSMLQKIATSKSSILNLDNNPLFHCSDLQGIILGVGLSMLEQMFIEQVRNEDGHKRVTAPKSKKRKAEQSGLPLVMADDDDADEPYYGAKGKKAKGGVGYAGNAREDVRQPPL